MKTWLRQLISANSAIRKRQPRSFERRVDRTEQLEQRQMLSAVSGLEEAAAAAEVAPPVVETLSAPATQKPGHRQNHGKAALTFPVVTGTWDLTASVVLDGDSPVDYTGTVQISQNKGKITGKIQLSGLPLFTLKGKLSKSEVTDFYGSTRIPVEISEGKFLGVRGSVELHFNQNLQSFSGTVNRTIFGYTIDVALTGTKQQ